MKIGVLKETFPGEARVALTPASALQQQKLEHECYVETGAGTAAQFADADYEAAGVTVCKTAADLIGTVDVIAKVRPPTDDEVDQLGKGPDADFLLLSGPERSTDGARQRSRRHRYRDGHGPADFPRPEDGRAFIHGEHRRLSRRYRGRQ